MNPFYKVVININLISSDQVWLGKCFRDFLLPGEKIAHEQAALNSEAECDNVG